MHYDEPDLRWLGDVVLSYSDQTECGEWRQWIIQDLIADDWEVEVGHLPRLPVWHLCTDCCHTEGGKMEYCLMMEIQLDMTYRYEEYGKGVWFCCCEVEE